MPPTSQDLPGDLRVIWLSGTLGIAQANRRVSRLALQAVHLSALCHQVDVSPRPIPFRITAVLLVGFARIHDRQWKQLKAEVAQAMKQLSLVDMQEPTILAPRPKATRTRKITLPTLANIQEDGPVHLLRSHEGEGWSMRIETESLPFWVSDPSDVLPMADDLLHLYPGTDPLARGIACGHEEEPLPLEDPLLPDHVFSLDHPLPLDPHLASSPPLPPSHYPLPDTTGPLDVDAVLNLPSEMGPPPPSITSPPRSRKRPILDIVTQLPPTPGRTPSRGVYLGTCPSTSAHLSALPFADAPSDLISLWERMIVPSLLPPPTTTLPEAFPDVEMARVEMAREEVEPPILYPWDIPPPSDRPGSSCDSYGTPSRPQRGSGDEGSSPTVVSRGGEDPPSEGLLYEDILFDPPHEIDHIDGDALSFGRYITHLAGEVGVSHILLADVIPPRTTHRKVAAQAFTHVLVLATHHRITLAQPDGAYSSIHLVLE